MINYLKKIWHATKHKISPEDIAIFFRQLAVLIQAEIPIIQSLEVLEKSQEKQMMCLLIFNLRKEILAGKNLFLSFLNHTYHFDRFACHLIKLGEQTGKLSSTLLMVADYHERELKRRKDIKQALFYPCVITLIALGMTLLMLIFIVPKFAELYDGMTNKLPLFTIFLFRLSAAAYHLLWLLPLLFICTYFFKSKIIALYPWLARLPGLTSLLHKIHLARFARHLAIAFAAGIPITDALLLSASTNHQATARAFALLHNKVRAGQQLHRGMAELRFFPPMLLQMTKIGEESGQLDRMLHKSADFLEAEIEQWITRFNQLLEPLIMLVLGVLIGGLVIGMYLPIFNLGSTL
ncbi:MAG: type II secretion system F family protein [Gammaproteobacteria bacterium]